MYLTEKELLVRQQEQLFGIQKLIKSSNVSLDDITELIPGLIHLNKLHILDLVYIDKKSREILEVKKEDVLKDGREILKNIVKPESFQQAKKQFGHIDFDEPSQVVSHFQALKGFKDKNTYQWFFSVKKKFNSKLILTVTNPVQSLGAMHKQIEKIIEDNQFIRNNLSKINSLTPREKEIMKLISKGCTSKQIAEELFVSPYTIDTHRKNIRKKLEINNYSELLKFAEQFDLV